MSLEYLSYHNPKKEKEINNFICIIKSFGFMYGKITDLGSEVSKIIESLKKKGDV